MSDSDLLQLYSGRILALAASVPPRARLPAPDGSARRRAPTCGSTVGVDVTMQAGRIHEAAMDVRACALGQAAASVVGAALPGLTEAEVRAGRDALLAMLKEGGPPPPAPFSALDALVPAREHANRHGSIMLAFEAALEAMADARSRAG